MKTGIFKPVFKTVFKRKETKIFLLFSAYPLILLIATFFKSAFMNLNADKGSLSFIEFFQAMLSVQYQMALPLIALFYLVVTVFRDEIKRGYLFLYKDISKKKIFNAKIQSLSMVYMIYLFALFLFSMFVYYVRLIQFDYTSKTFFPVGADNIAYVVVGILGVILVTVVGILVVADLSLLTINSVAVVGGIVFVLVSTISKYFATLSWLFPNSYTEIYEKFGFGNSMILMLVLFIIYAAVFTSIGKHFFKKLEY